MCWHGVRVTGMTRGVTWHMGQVSVESRVERWDRRGRRVGSLTVFESELLVMELVWGFCSQLISESSSSSSPVNGADAAEAFFVGAIVAYQTSLQ